MFNGVFTALVTPFYSNGAVNCKKLGELIEKQRKAGVHGIVLLGTTGEAPTVTEKEREIMMETAQKNIGSLKLIVGCASNSTEKATEQAKIAEKSGAQSLLVLTPYYNKTNEAGIERHFCAIADAVNIPVIIYHVPARTGCKLTVSTVERLSRHPNIAGIKEASGDMNFFMSISHLAGPDFEILCGNDELCVPMMSMGASGVISVVSNLYPEAMVEMVSEAQKGDYIKASSLQKQMLPVINALFSEPNPIPVKAAMNYLKMDVGPLRLPLYEMEENNRKKMESILNSIHFTPFSKQ